MSDLGKNKYMTIYMSYIDFMVRYQTVIIFEMLSSF